MSVKQQMGPGHQSRVEDSIGERIATESLVQRDNAIWTIALLASWKPSNWTTQYGHAMSSLTVKVITFDNVL